MLGNENPGRSFTECQNDVKGQADPGRLQAYVR